jgi:Tol biopolymer transport system component
LSDPYIDVYHPSWSPDGSQIAFCAQTKLHVKILTVLTDGSGTLTKLSPKRADDCYPDWSPDGTTIAFMAFPSSGPYEIWKMDADGHNRAKLATGATPSWSPDGTQIAFTKKVRKRNEVFTMNADSSGITRITHSAKRWEFSPAFSPDGTEIAYSRTVGTHFYDTDDIWTIPVAGGTPTQLIDTPALDEFGVSWQPIPIP